jgi:HEAT repeat protein
METIDALWAQVRSGEADQAGAAVAGTATLALGSLGQRLSAAHDARYGELRTELLGGAVGVGDASQRAMFIKALGNTGDATLSLQIVPLLSDSEPVVRSAAAHSLGALGTDAAADELVARLRQENVATVRSAIAESLVTWSAPTPSAMEAMRRDVVVEREDRARLAMAQVLGRNLAAYPQNRTALETLMRTERSDLIRRQVASMLAAGH